jgi:NADH-quinone oxidoreductase subunit M
MHFPVLSFIVFTPAVAALVLFMLPVERKTEARLTALAAGTFALLLSIWAYFSYDISAGGYQFVEQYAWLPSLGISYHVGIDGMSAPLILLTGVVMFTGVLISWGIDDRPREFFGFLFILATGVFGVFISLDLFMLFFFYEIAVFPMYLLISIWGWKQTREYAAMKLTLYLFIGSVVSLVGALAMYFQAGLNTGIYTFDMLEMEKAGFTLGFQQVWFPFVFLGFAVLGGIFPFHNWSPDGHVAAPTAVSMFHAGVLMKLGAFAALRVGVMLLPEGAKTHMWWVILLALVNVVYGAFIASVQMDFKYVIGFSSVSHMGLVMMGFATLNNEGFLGAGIQMFSHGVMTALFFAVVGMVYDQAHTRDIPKLGGFIQKMPWVAIAFTIGGLVSMGMPGFSGFVAEFPIFLGVWKTQPWIAMVAAISIVVTASYMIRVIRRVFFGNLAEEFEQHVHDVTILDKVALGFLSTILVVLGVYPSMMFPVVESGVQHILRLLGGA